MKLIGRKRRRSNSNTNSATCYPLTERVPIDTPRSFVPARGDGPRFLEFLVYCACMTSNVADNYHDSLREQSAPTFINPFQHLDAARQRVIWDAASDPDAIDALWHAPLISIGSERHNHAFCRVSAQTSDPHTLWISFRPFMMYDIDAMIRSKQAFRAISVLSGRRTATPAPREKTLENLLHLMMALKDRGLRPAGDAFEDVGEGYATILAATPLPMTIENAFEELPEYNAGFGPHVRGVMAEFLSVCDFRTGACFENVESPSMIHGLARFVQAYRPKKVVFCGFSLGGGSALAAAYMCHKILGSENAPTTHVVSFAGTMAGGARMAAYAARHFASCTAVQLVGRKLDGRTVLEDPVTHMPFSSKFLQMGTVLRMDFADKTIDALPGPIAGKNRSNRATWWPLVGAEVLGGGGWMSDISAGFKKVHGPGESMIVRLLILRMLNAGARSPLLNHLDCKFFSEFGAPSKYRVCPEQCTVVEKRSLTASGKTVAKRKTKLRCSCPTDKANRREIQRFLE